MTTLGRIAATSKSLLHCALCDLVLPLRAPRSDEVAELWTCAGCEGAFTAVFDASAPAEYFLRARRALAPPGTPAPAELPGLRKPAATAEARMAQYVPRGTSTVALPRRPAAAWPPQTSAGWQIDISITRGEVLRLAPQGRPLSAHMAVLGAVPHDRQLAAEMVAHLDTSAAQLLDVFMALDQSRRADMAALPVLAESAIVQAAKDPDLFAALGLGPPTAEYPQRQSLHTCMLAMSVAMAMGLDRRTILDLLLGCLIHDAGMLRLNDVLRAEDRVLNRQEVESIASHPMFTLDMLAAHLDAVPVASRLVAYQIHERCDGSGYPRRRAAGTIHPLAKIAAVADVFVALVSPRPYRPALMPYFAMEYLVRGAAQGVFEPQAVRGLLSAVSLFPLGSYVELSDGRAAKVLRSNRAMFDRPIVHVVDRAGRTAGTEIVDLAQLRGEVRIVRPVPPPQAA